MGRPSNERSAKRNQGKNTVKENPVRTVKKKIIGTRYSNRSKKKNKYKKALAKTTSTKDEILSIQATKKNKNILKKHFFRQTYVSCYQCYGKKV